MLLFSLNNLLYYLFIILIMNLIYFCFKMEGIPIFFWYTIKKNWYIPSFQFFLLQAYVTVVLYKKEIIFFFLLVNKRMFFHSNNNIFL